MTRRRRSILILVALIASIGWISHADAAKPRRHHVLTLSRAYSSIVVDAATGAVLQEDNADAPKYPASLTKMMTLYLVFDALESGKLTLNTRLPVSVHAAEQSPTKLGLRAGEQIAVRDVILGMVTRSANDAAVVAAEALGGTEEHFAEMMTQRARRLGMASTTWQNASGLPNPLQMTTARDLSRLSRALIRDFPQHYVYFSTPEFTYAGQRIANHNHLMSWYEGMDGIKTGFISAAGFNLAASAVRDNRRLIGVVLGGPSPLARDHYMGKLLDVAFAEQGIQPRTDIREAAATPAPATRTKRGKLPAVAAAEAAAKKTKRRSSETDVAATAAASPGATLALSHKPGTDSEHGWAIQVGAFNKIEGARRAAEAATKLAATPLVDASIEISSLRVKKHKHNAAVHRARLMGLTSDQAHDACNILVKADRDCVVLSPTDLRGPSVRMAIN
ncbi:MAG TPA: D-alanyl-D-alanine carboxypeptidase family protein [Alphaproteobacteria bacterium]